MKEDNNNFSSELNADISYPHISDKASINKNCASHLLPSYRDKNLYKKFELFLSKNKFHLNNDYDKNNAQIFLKEKNQFLANVVLDDYIEGEEEKTVIEQGNSTFIKNSVNNTLKKNTTKKTSNNNNNNNINKNINVNVNNKKSNNQVLNPNINNNIKNNDNKKGVQNQSFEGGTMGGPPGSLFDTGKADLLCLLLGMSNK
jgi:hypothetical protein